jgi:hypothetical protein
MRPASQTLWMIRHLDRHLVAAGRRHWQHVAMEPAAVSKGLTATASIASAHGLVVEDPIVLKNSNRLTVHLVQCNAVARTAAPARRGHDGAAFELQMALQFGAADRLVAALDPRVEPIVHVRDGFAVTYWKYYAPLASVDLAPDDYARALEGLPTSPIASTRP